MSVKVTVNLPEETIEALKVIAARRGTTLTEAIQESIDMNKFLLDREVQQGKVLIERADGKFERVVRPSSAA
jgi:plasmid stability protein